MEVVELTLASLNTMALAVHQGIEAARRVACEYKPVFERTAKHTIPFIAIQRTLRGERAYMMHYVALLDRLGIDHDPLKIEGFTWDDDAGTDVE